ncbi:hypothetical protein [Nonomuraea rubra]|uniref:Uncharacterized protein n=1 Tax=Nonomuraea rubra TaxID=46180 RepID=A0A7X0P7M5_9ACTN|nr:hypothetical protein [Nonomuraea rubra]MBB6556736.1 hypothetical protein [Nonomuraea rubra]
MNMTLAELTSRTGLTVLDHLEQSVRIPVLDGLQAQGDLIVIPMREVDVTVWGDARWQPVPAEGVELLRGAAGGNPHTLVAEPGTCRWTRLVRDGQGLAIGVFDATAPVYLLHPEHGGSGCAPGTYVVRRQREHEGSRSRLVAD